jgi:hypothetical protein
MMQMKFLVTDGALKERRPHAHEKVIKFGRR